MTKSIDISEKELHKLVIAYLKYALDQKDWFTTFPLGGGGKIRGQSLKNIGTKSGTPDILIISKGKPFWIELKTKTGVVSKVQTDCHKLLREAGSDVCVSRSVSDVQNALISWGFNLRVKILD